MLKTDVKVKESNVMEELVEKSNVLLSSTEELGEGAVEEVDVMVQFVSVRDVEKEEKRMEYEREEKRKVTEVIDVGARIKRSVFVFEASPWRVTVTGVD